MRFWLQVLASLWCVTAPALAGSSSPIYNIKIKKDPVKLSKVEGDHFEIISVYGQQFTCIVPTIAQRHKPTDSLSETTTRDIKNIFSSWNTTDCLIWSAGWWNYKLCTGKEISQYHEDKGSALVTTSLGTFTRDFDWTQADPSDLQVRHKYHSQFYDHGTLCDVTGKPRSTEVRFVCRRDLPFPTILDVTEVLTCSYVVRVAAADLCTISALEPQDDLKPNELVCSPSLSDEAYSKFQQAAGQRIFEQNLLKEERDFQKVIRTLPARRRAFLENVLKSRRSYRKRLNLGLKLTARRLRQQSIDFLRLVENNFDDLNQFSVNKIRKFLDFKQPLTSGPNYGHDFAEEPNPGNLVERLKSLISFRLPKKGTETTNLVFADGDFLRRLEVYNRTLDIASILLDHMRRSFEGFIERGRRPRTTQMMAGFLNLLRRFVSVTSTDVLARVQKALQRYRPRRLYQPYSRSPSFDDFLASPQLGIERSSLGILNSTIGFSRNVATILLLQTHVSTFLSDEYSIKAPEHVVVDEAPFSSDDLHEIDQVALAESLTQFRKALNSPKLRTTLEALTSNKAQTLSLRAAVQPVGDDKLALVITAHDDVATLAEHAENVENYKTKVTFG